MGLTEFTCSVRDIISDLQKKRVNIASIFYLRKKIFKHEQTFLIKFQGVLNFIMLPR
jgi:hypothetical protein